MKKLIQFLEKLTKKNVPNFTGSKYPVEFAFSLDGKDYFRFTDLQNMPPMRALMSLAIYNRMVSGCTKEFLKEAINEIENQFKERNFSPFHVNRILEITKLIKERNEWIADGKIAYELAAVTYFTKEENILSISETQIKKKAELFENYPDQSFFLNVHLRSLIPFGDSPELDLDTYFEVQKKVKKVHSERMKN